jgi:DNA repair exonuclease SbcCD nuclease subunit
VAIDPTTLAAFKSAILRADAIDKENKKLQADFKARSTKLVAAVKEKDGPLTELLREQLGTSVDKAEDCLSDIEKFLRVDIAHIQRDKDFAESKSGQIEKLVGVISAAQSSLTRQFELAKQIDASAEKMLKAQATGKARPCASRPSSSASSPGAARSCLR